MYLIKRLYQRKNSSSIKLLHKNKLFYTHFVGIIQKKAENPRVFGLFLSIRFGKRCAAPRHTSAHRDKTSAAGTAHREILPCTLIHHGIALPHIAFRAHTVCIIAHRPHIRHFRAFRFIFIFIRHIKPPLLQYILCIKQKKVTKKRQPIGYAPLEASPKAAAFL